MNSTGQNFVESSETLCEILAVFRHGHRAPVMFLPSDPHKNFWPNGPGNLTNIGKEDGYLIGKLLRERYSKFLNDKYDGEEIYVRSTDVDRNLMTAQCCLAGLYPPKDDDVWMPGMTWQPIPIHTVPFRTDEMIPQFAKTFTPPPKEDNAGAANAAYKNISENQHVIDGITSDIAVGNIQVAHLLLDAFKMEADAGLPPYLPPGVHISPQEVDNLAKSFYLLSCKTGKSIISSIRLMEEILKQASRKVAGELPKHKAFLYCMHDITISACLEAFNCSRRAKFGAILLFEIHKRPTTNEYFIKVLYKSSIRDAADLEVIPINESQITPFSDFEVIVKAFAANKDNLDC